MKKLFYIGFVGLVFAYGFTTLQTTDNCDKKALTASCKKKLKPYKYDSQKFTKIAYKKKLQQLEVEVPVFIGEKYRLVFNTSALSKPVLISIYTKDKESRKREAIYTSKDIKDNEIIFDAPRVRKLFVDYDVPADSATTTAVGCLILMVGYN